MKIKPILFALICLFLFNSCKTIRELRNFAKCEFRLKDIAELRLAGINLQAIKSPADINLMDAGKIALAFKNGSLPLDITFNVEVKNPNDKTAAMEKLDWILSVDKNDMVNGTTNERVEVAPNGGISSFAVKTGIDIRKSLDKESLNSILNLVSAVSGKNDENARIALKIKPRFIIAGLTMGYPGYIKVGKTFKAAGDE